MKHEYLFIHLSPEGVFRYIMKVLSAWNIRCSFRRSYGNSWYIKLELGTPDHPITIHIRISDHNAVKETSLFDFDVMCWAARDGARGIRPVAYTRLLKILAVRLNRELPPLCRALLEYSKEHAAELQYNSRHRAWRPVVKEAKLYLNEN